MSALRLNVAKPRQDRNNPEKTYWDPIGTLFIKGVDDDGNEVELPKLKVFGSIFAIGDVSAFPPREAEGGSSPF
jgi:hypothetical protein